MCEYGGSEKRFTEQIVNMMDAQAHRHTNMLEQLASLTSH